MVVYFKAVDDEKLLIRHNDSDNFDEYFLERYDFTEKKWVSDSSLGGIYIGEPLTDVISEEEAYRLIDKYSKDT